MTKSRVTSNPDCNTLKKSRYSFHFYLDTLAKDLPFSRLEVGHTPARLRHNAAPLRVTISLQGSGVLGTPPPPQKFLPKALSKICDSPDHPQGPQARILQNCCGDCCGNCWETRGVGGSAGGTAAETTGGLPNSSRGSQA